MVADAKAKLVRTLLLGMVVCAAAACGDALGGASDHEDDAPNNEISELPPVDSVGVRPNSLQMTVGGSTRLSLYVRDATGMSLTPDEYDAEWTSENKDIVRVDPDGQIHAVAPGVTRITAFVRGIKGWGEVRVSRKVDRIEIMAPERPLIPGEGAMLEARVWSEQGERIDDATVIWSIVATDAAQMRQGGHIRALRPGYVTVTAMHDGVAGRKTLSIDDYNLQGIRVANLPERLAAGESVEVEPVAIGYDNYPLEHVDISLRSLDDRITVDGTSIRGDVAGYGRLEVEAAGYSEQRDVLVYEPFVALDAGRTHGCAIDAIGRAFCWGANTYGEVGSSILDSQGRPVLVSSELRFQQLSAGSFHTCGVTDDNALYCWGANRNGKLGDGTTIDRWSPVRIAEDTQWASVSAGASHTCGLSTDGEAFCWGSNKNGERLGTGRIGDAWEPERVAGSLSFSQISAGLEHTCALRAETNKAWCWGSNEHLQLGREADLTQTDDGRQISRVPLRVSGDYEFESVDAALAHSYSCGRTVDDEIACWGNNRLGALLEGGSDYPTSDTRDPLESARPVPIHDQVTRYDGLDVGAHACGLRDGQIYCWTDGFHTVQVHPYLPPPRQYSVSRLEALTSFEAVSAGQKFTCAISVGGDLYCAGRDFQRFAESQGFTPSSSRLYQLLMPDLPEYQPPSSASD